MKLDGIYNPFASGEKTIPQPSETTKLPNERQPIPPIQQQPARAFPIYQMMKMQ